jgi:hypothetical protein
VLTTLDETLRHQLPTTFDHVWTSDPRFYDRVWFCCYDPAGSLALITSVGLYANMNVMDGFVSLMVPRADEGADQHNFRFSRALRPNIDEVAVGPLSVEILEPFERIRLFVAEGEFPVGLDLEWRAEFPAVEEDQHFSRLRGRVTQDYRRYAQLGTATGSVTLHGKRHDVSDWFAARDHSWGVRTQVAGPEPVTGPVEFDPDFKGVMFYWLPFLTEEFGGHLQFHTDGERTRSFMEGALMRRDGTQENIVDASLEMEMHPGTRRWKRAVTTLTSEAGERFELVQQPLLRCFSMDGTGYDWGWNDDQGLGVYRGEYYTEDDVYDLSHPEKVVRPDGQVRTPMHRETATHVSLNGRPGTGHQVLIAVGPMAGYGLA